MAGGDSRGQSGHPGHRSIAPLGVGAGEYRGACCRTIAEASPCFSYDLKGTTGELEGLLQRFETESPANLRDILRNT